MTRRANTGGRRWRTSPGAWSTSSEGNSRMQPAEQHKMDAMVRSLPAEGMRWHRQRLLEQTRANTDTIAAERAVDAIPPTGKPVLLVSAGPSLYRVDPLRWLSRPDYRRKVVVVATDGAYIRCLNKGIRPDYVLTLDPHPTRIVRWFGDPDFDRHAHEDDYFCRQDLDIDFRAQHRQMNANNIRTVDASPVPLVICCSAATTVVRRTAKMPRYWFAPLVDSPESDGSLTAELCDMTGLPAMNTGGTVGNALFVFAHAYLQAHSIACVGMDFGYPEGTPLKQTQSYYMLRDTDGAQDYYPASTGIDGRQWFTDPTFAWYRQNLIDLLQAADGELVNCTGGGLLRGERVHAMDMETWLKSC